MLAFGNGGVEWPESGLSAWAKWASEWPVGYSPPVIHCGFHYIDAPVTGLPDTAAAGELTLLVGAEGAELEEARPILGAFSKRIIHFGAVGTGTGL